MSVLNNFHARFLPQSLRKLFIGVGDAHDPGKDLAQQFHKADELKRLLPGIKAVQWKRMGRVMCSISVEFERSGNSFVLPRDLLVPVEVDEDSDQIASRSVQACSRVLRIRSSELRRASMIVHECSLLFPTHERITLT